MPFINLVLKIKTLFLNHISWGEKVFTAPTVPIGMKTGVSICPCSTSKIPVLAEDISSDFFIVNFI